MIIPEDMLSYTAIRSKEPEELYVVCFENTAAHFTRDEFLYLRSLINNVEVDGETKRDEEDSSRLDWMAHHGVSLRHDDGHANPDILRGWYLTVSGRFNTYERFNTAREAIDARMKGENRG